MNKELFNNLFTLINNSPKEIKDLVDKTSGHRRDVAEKSPRPSFETFQPFSGRLSERAILEG